MDYPVNLIILWITLYILLYYGLPCKSYYIMDYPVNFIILWITL
jgi:hypothetical protein